MLKKCTDLCFGTFYVFSFAILLYIAKEFLLSTVMQSKLVVSVLLLFLVGIGKSLTYGQGCQPATSQAILDINAVRALIPNNGALWFDGNGSLYQVPKAGSDQFVGINAFLTAALLMGGIRASDSQLVVAGSAYFQQSYWPGPIDATTRSVTTAECTAFDRSFDILLSDIVDFRTRYAQNLITSPAQIPQSIREWPGRGNPFLAAIPFFTSVNLNRALAPFVDVNNDLVYNPLQGDYPSIKGDQYIWFILNDIGNQKTFTTGTSPGGGFEIHGAAYAYSTGDVLNYASVYDYTIINRSIHSYNDFYTGFFVDTDLGFPGDDNIGCDIVRGLGYVYNGDGFDDGFPDLGYGYNPPTAGMKFIKGMQAPPGDGKDNNFNGVVDEPSERFVFSTFITYLLGQDPRWGDPQSAMEYYRYLRGVRRDGNPFTFDLLYSFTDWDTAIHPNSQVLCPTTYLYPGRSNQQVFWSCGGTIANPGGPYGYLTPNTVEWFDAFIPTDRRFIMAQGPGTLLPGSLLDLTAAAVYSRTNSNNRDVQLEDLFITADEVQCQLDGSCLPPVSFNGPQVTLTPEASGIRLNWLPDTFTITSGAFPVVVHTESFGTSVGGTPYLFQGYQVFQLRSSDVSFSQLDDTTRARPIAQFDLVDNIDTLLNFEPSAIAGLLVPKLKVAGTNQGIQRTFLHTTDAFTGAVVDFNVPYYYAVVAYASATPQGAVLRPYVRSRGNAVVVQYAPSPSGVPSLIANGFEVTRLSGTGGGGSRIQQLLPAVLDSVVNGLAVQQLTYSSGRGPIVPYKIVGIPHVSAPMYLQLFTYIRYSQATAPIQPGDTLFSLVDTTRAGLSIDSAWANRPRRPGVAVVERLLSTTSPSQGTLAVRMLNDHVGGVFVRQRALSISGFLFGYYEEPAVFQWQGGTALCNESTIADIARVVRTDLPDTVWLPSRISAKQNQQILAWGIGISIPYITDLPFTSLRDQDRFGRSITASTIGIVGLSGVVNNFFFSDVEKVNLPPQAFMLNNRYQNGWFPYRIAMPMYKQEPFISGGNISQSQNTGVSRYSSASIQSPSTLPSDRQLERDFTAGNYRVVFTDDSSLWTRAVVLQHRFRTNLIGTSGSNQNRFRLLKSSRVSVDKTGIPDSSALSPFSNQLSRGMGWFPGYAIDLDRGVRVNMAFAEDRNVSNGNNLLWEPDTSQNGANSFVYVLRSAYDPTAVEFTWDSTAPYVLSSIIPSALERWFASQVVWVGSFRQTIGLPVLAGSRTFDMFADVPFISTVPGTPPTFRFNSGTSGGGGPAGIVALTQSVDTWGIYPNPTRGDIQLYYAAHAPLQKLEIWSMAGTLVQTITESELQSGRISFKGFATGAYLIRAFQGSKVSVRKLVVE